MKKIAEEFDVLKANKDDLDTVSKFRYSFQHLDRLYLIDI